MIAGAGMAGNGPTIDLDGVAFDLDGTLIDSAPEIAGAVNALLAERGRPALALDRVTSMVGDGSAALVARAFAASGDALGEAAHREALARFLEIYEAWPADPGQVYPGVAATLDALAASGLRLGLCTNKPERVTRAVLEAVGLARFFAVVAGGDTLAVRKPDPRHLAHVLDGMGVAPRRAAMVGDNAHDMAVARALGVPGIAVSYGYPRMPVADLGADAVVDRFDEIPAALARLRPSR
jgi:phosphoglycolate phosphatase